MSSICITITSHGQFQLVKQLVTSLEQHVGSAELEIIIVKNIPEQFELQTQLNYRLIENVLVKGFAANHNQAVAMTRCDFVCILNPDVRFTCDPFPDLLAVLADPNIGVVAPLITDSTGKIEDSVRKFLSPWRLFKRVILAKRQPDYLISNAVIKPDWVAGMFMLFKREVFQQIGGFDERYFLYCEDVDICYRLRQAGYEVALNTAVTVIHDAQRTSHRSFKYLWLHIKSLLRFFISHPKTLLS